jgi:hypothetical protein
LMGWVCLSVDFIFSVFSFFQTVLCGNNVFINSKIWDEVIFRNIINLKISSVSFSNWFFETSNRCACWSRLMSWVCLSVNFILSVFSFF